jgi:hypothetical protein
MNLIERLRDAARTTHGAESYIWVKPDDLQEAISALESFQWIPVSERLPEKFVIVPVALADQERTYAMWKGGNEWEDAVCYTQEYDDVIFDKLDQPPLMWFSIPTPPAAQ